MSMWCHVIYNLEDNFKNLQTAINYIQNTNILAPHIPKYRLDFEDEITPRICVCPSVIGCIQALGTYIFHRCCNSYPATIAYVQTDREVYPIIVMYLESDHVIKPMAEQVPDAEETDEHWILSPAKVIKSEILWLNPWSIKFEDDVNPKPIDIVTYKTSQVKHLDHPWLNKRGHNLNSNESHNEPMKNNYKHTKTTVSFINYHFVFCPRYRRKIFNIPGLESRFKGLVTEECARHNIEIINMECHIDHVYMLVSALPDMSIPKIMQHIKGCTSNVLRQEFPVLAAMPSLWTRNYFVSTEDNVSPETIKWYVDTQKTRP